MRHSAESRLGRDLDKVVMNIDSGALGCNSHLDTANDFELDRIQCDRGRCPVCKLEALMLS